MPSRNSPNAIYFGTRSQNAVTPLTSILAADIKTLATTGLAARQLLFHCIALASPHKILLGVES